jgi:riboflavin kinase/FMN adenylyltransferase
LDREKKVIALGFFDGVHKGHASLLKKTTEVAKRYGAVPSVITFDEHPGSLVEGHKMELITSPEDRAEVIRRYFSINEIIVVHFDDIMMHMHWEDFINWLVGDFSAIHFVAGHDFRFGYKGRGNPENLTAKCAELGIGCDIMPKVTLDGITISSTYIRTLLKEGKIEKANAFLGHPHSLSGTVHFGYKLGRNIGAPTINMNFPDNVLIPAHGVYAVSLHIEEEPETHYAVTNIGVRPTVSGEGSVTVESFIMNFKRNVYGKHVRLEFHKMLRPEMKFDSVEELKRQIQMDVRAVKDYFGL